MSEDVARRIASGILGEKRVPRINPDDIRRSYGMSYGEIDGNSIEDPLPSPSEVGLKFDSSKPRMALLPPKPLAEIAEVLTFGAEKYAAHNWNKGIAFERLYSALQRHLNAWWAGEELDPESGICHLAHAGCMLLFIMELRHAKPEFDDRPKGLTAPFERTTPS